MTRIPVWQIMRKPGQHDCTVNQPSLNNSLFFFHDNVFTLVNQMTTRAKTTASADLNFEIAMERLEKIVEQMESGKLALEDLIIRYEEGMGLVKICQERLATAEQKIEIIARISAGKPVIKPFEAAEEAPAGTEKENGTDEVRLF